MPAERHLTPLASARSSRRPSPIGSDSHHEKLSETQKIEADPYRAKAKERLGIPLDKEPSKTQARKIKSVAGQIRQEEETAQLTKVFNSLHQEGFNAGQDVARHQFEQDKKKLEEEASAVIQAVIESYRNPIDNFNRTDADEHATESNLTVKEADLIEQVLSAIFGEAVHFHLLQRRDDYIAVVTALEDKYLEPIRPDCKEFQEIDTNWISEVGIHFGWDTVDEEIVFAARITPWNEVSHYDCQALGTMMEWTTVVNRILNNGSQKGPSKHLRSQLKLIKDESNLPVHGNTCSKKVQNIRPQGSMFGAGYHNSFEANKVLVTYAPRQTQAALKKFESTAEDLQTVLTSYREAFTSLFGSAFKQIDRFSIDHHLPSFSDFRFDGSKVPERPFANSLTITRDDFANFQHLDRDQVSYAFGRWWTAKVPVEIGGEYELVCGESDQAHVQGGGFLWGQYGVGINFERCAGLVDIVWRGNLHAHCTMQSTSDNGYTRFGTSIQVTKSGADAVERFWKAGGKRNLVSTVSDRTRSLHKRMQKSVKRM